MKNIKNNFWFTLVELIVTITILAILATIAFISLQWYLSWARDSVRISDLSNINKALAVMRTKNWSVIKPENFIPITLSWSVIWYQWDANKYVLDRIGISNWWVDPLTDEYYSYFINRNAYKFQLLWFLENDDSVKVWLNNKTYADNSDKYMYVKWDWLGILTDNLNVPIHRVDAVKTEWEFDTIWSVFASMDVKALFSNDKNETQIAMLVWWQMMQLSKVNNYAPPSDCPENFIPVSWSEDLWQPWFCVWKYEASLDENDSTKFTTKPWLNVVVASHDVKDKCLYIWDNYNTISFKQWLTIARSIEKVDENWSTGIAWDWYIKSWNNWSTTTWFDLWTTILQSWPSWNTTQDDLRQLKLWNWEVIWDFIWNAWEYTRLIWVNRNHYDNVSEWNSESNNFLYKLIDNISNFYSDSIINTGSPYSWSDLTGTNFKENYWPIFEWWVEKWFWSVIDVNNVAWYAIWVWWDRNGWENLNWLYSMILKIQSIWDSLWTRCIYEK